MDGNAHFGDPGPLFGGTEGTLDTAPTHGGECGGTLMLISSGGRKESGLVTVSFPVSAEQREGLCGQGDGPVFGTLAAVEMDLEALAVNIRALKGKGFREPEAQAVDGGAGDLVVQGGGGGKEPPDLLHTEDSGETVCSLCAQERQRVPVALEDMLREEANTAGADTHGRWSEAVDVFPVQEVALQLLFRNVVGWFMVELREQAYFPDRGFLRPFAFATEVEGRKHLLTQWAHAISPFVRRVVRLRRKTS
jgi:hypothetical protein